MILECKNCGKEISQEEWKAFKFSNTFQCCGRTSLVEKRGTRFSGSALGASIGADTGEREENDFYRTGPPATKALLSKEVFEGTIWEPACGMGDMAEVLKQRGRVIATDLIDYGYGRGGVDFLTAKPRFRFDHIVTNPPFGIDEKFIYRAIDLAPPGGKVAMLLRTVWLEGVRRRDGIYKRSPPTRIWIISKRPPMAKGRNGAFFTGMMSFSWFVWEKDYTGLYEPPVLGTRIGWV